MATPGFVMRSASGQTASARHSQSARRYLSARSGALSSSDWFARDFGGRLVFGIRLETSTNPRSTNVTFGDDDQVNGPFSKDSDRISVGQAYFGYKGLRDLTLTVGKMANPFITSSMIWDPDINPEGLAEQWKHTFNLSFGGGESSPGSMSKDGKTMTPATTSEPTKMTIDVFANFAQFVYRRHESGEPDWCQSPGFTG